MARATTVRFTDDMSARLDQASAQTGMPVNSIVIAACLEWMSRHVERTPLLAGGPASGAFIPPAPRWATLRRAVERAAIKVGSPLYPFERFTKCAQKMLTTAQSEATKAGVPYIGTEHLLLAALDDPASEATRILASLGLSEGEVRPALEKLLSQKKVGRPGSVIPTSRVKVVIEMAFQMCAARGDERVSTGHILLALSTEGRGGAAHVMKDFGAGTERIEAALDSRPEREA